MTHPSTPRRAALATLVLATMTAVACGHSSPAAPDAAASSKDAAAAAPSALLAARKPGSPSGSATVKFSLLSGTFTIANRKGDQIRGSYSGETVFDGDSITTLRLDVQEGTGTLAGARGVLEGKGRGAFTGEGEFSLDVSGSLDSAGKKRAKFGVSLKGWANIGCEAGTIVITLNGDAAHAHGEFRHEVANAGCGS